MSSEMCGCGHARASHNSDYLESCPLCLCAAFRAKSSTALRASTGSTQDERAPSGILGEVIEESRVTLVRLDAAPARITRAMVVDNRLVRRPVLSVHLAPAKDGTLYIRIEESQ